MATTPLHDLFRRAPAGPLAASPTLPAPAGAPPAAGRRVLRPRRSSLVAALGLATVTVLGVLPAGTSSADPAPTLAEVEQRTAELDEQADAAVEDYQAAQVELDAATRRAEAAQAQVRGEQAALDAQRAQVGEVVAAAYRNGAAGAGLSLLTSTSDPKAYVDRATSLDRLAADQADTMAEVATARARYESALHRADADVAAQRTIEARMAERRTAIEATLAEQQRLLDGLKEEERQRLAAEKAAAEAAAAAAAAQQAAAEQAAATAAAQAQQTAVGGQSARASRSRTAAPAAAADAPQAAAAPASTGRTAAVVREAYAKLGTPYRWGASGPGSFDCSGFTAWVWAKAGVSLPHSSQAQYAGGRKVSRADLQPGDLVFYGSPIHHVGLYVGGGQMISAPHTGDVVKVQAAFRGDYVGAVRP